MDVTFENARLWCRCNPPQCDGEAHVWAPPGWAGAPFARPCRCPGAASWRGLREALLTQHGDRTFDSFHHERQREAYNTIRAFARDWSARGLLLMGPPGVGKSHLAVAVLLEGVRARKTPAFVAAHELARLLSDAAGYDAPASGARQRLDALRAADVLVLDDLGSLRPSPAVLEGLRGFVDSIVGLVVITSNVSLADLESLLGAPIVSRLRERCVPVVFQAGDYRAELGKAQASALRAATYPPKNCNPLADNPCNASTGNSLASCDSLPK